MSQKYDRQLRLWTSSGQELISSSRVLIMGTSLAQCEVLKNLILAGIGFFNIVGVDAVISENDVENNFYLNDEDVGEPLTKTIAMRLNELNSDTIHSFVNLRLKDFENYLRSSTDDYDIVITDELIKYEIYAKNVPILEFQSKSFYSFVHSRFNELCIIDSHASVVPDLKLLRPWTGLKEFFNSFDLNVSPDELSKIPYPVLLYKLVSKFRFDFGRMPESKDLKDFKKFIKDFSGDEDLLNVGEAIRNAHMVILKAQNPDFDVVDSLVSDDRLIEMKDEFKSFKGSYNEKFWVLVFVLNEYLATYGQLPVSDELPDMDSDTTNYLALKKIYRQEFENNIFNFKNLLAQTTEETQIGFKIEDEMILKFVKNCRILHHSVSNSNSKSLTTSSFNSPTDSKFKLIGYTLTLLAEFPETPKNLSKYDFFLQKSEFQNNENFQSILYEILRSNESELLNISSITGGVVAQEALKILMRQYIPLQDIWVFDGITCESERFTV